MSSSELLDLVRRGEIEGLEILQVLRNPYCTPEIVEKISENRHWLTSHQVRELLAGFRGMPMARAMNLLATLPWLSLMEVARSPRTPPGVRRLAEKKILVRISTMTLGEKIALARRAHRPLIRPLISTTQSEVLIALLDNPFLVENDVHLMLNTITPPPSLITEIVRHSRWGSYYGVRLALVECKHTPLPLAMSSMVQLTRIDLKGLCERPDLRDEIKDAAKSLLEKARLRTSPIKHKEGLCHDFNDTSFAYSPIAGKKGCTK
jgi:hypothetical protein